MRLIIRVFTKKKELEPDPFGRPGGKHGGVPAPGSGYDRAWKAIQKKNKENKKNTNEELDIQEWIEALIEEGYNLDEYSDDELYEAYLCELNKAEKELGMSSWQAEIGRNKRYKNAHVKPSQRKPDSYFYDKGNLTPDPSSGESTSWHDSMSKARKISRELNREELDLYDIVSEYLVTEGFCDSYEDADVIMANMSEEWRDGILDEVTGGGK